MRKGLTLFLSFVAVLVISGYAHAGRALNYKEINTKFATAENEERLLKLGYTFSALASGETAALTDSVPADSLITDVSVYVNTAIVSASDNTVSLGCATASDLDAAFDFTDTTANSVVEGTPRVDDPSTWVYTSGGCTPTLTVGAGTTGVVSGRSIYLIRYIMPETQSLEEE